MGRGAGGERERRRGSRIESCVSLSMRSNYYHIIRIFFFLFFWCRGEVQEWKGMEPPSIILTDGDEEEEEEDKKKEEIQPSVSLI